MKTYTKIHSSQKVADIHLMKIRKRSGTATSKKVAGGIQIDYWFPGTTSAPTNKPKRYDMLSPDGFSIRLRDQGLFNSVAEAKAYFRQWKKRFESQGYYASGYGHIELDDLESRCELREIH